MTQTLKLKRGSLENLPSITGSLQKGEILFASASSIISTSNGSSILFIANNSGSVQAANRIMRTTGSSAPIFSASLYGGLVDGLPFYASGSSTLFLLGNDSNEAINLVGNIQPFSQSVATSFSASNASIASVTGDFSSSVATSFSTSLASQISLSSSLASTNNGQTDRIVNLESSASNFDNAITLSGVGTGSTVTIKGNLNVQGIQTNVDSTTINLADNILQLNAAGTSDGGIIVRDATGGSTTSGSLLWDVTTDYWKAGKFASESKILLATGDNVVSSSSQVDITSTTGYSTFSQSLATTNSASVYGVTTLSSSVSQSIADLNSSIVSSGIFKQTGSVYATTNTIEITGSLNVSGSINPDNVTVGIPSANAWQSGLGGSYFNNFTSETNVSEILRFVAGLLSASAPDASPNTKTFGSISANAVNTTTGTALTGRIPQSSTNTTITYLNGKGFASNGSTIFSGITPIYTNTSYGYTYTSVAAGSTIASSSVDTQLFGLGLMSNGTPTNFKVSGSFTYRFKDNSTKTDTATSSSQALITQTGAGTTSGVSLALINTANPAVIPPAYQDGKFAAAFSPALFNNGASAISGSGYYHISASVSIASGSSTLYTTPVVSNAEVFYAPLSTISTNVAVQTPTINVGTYSALTATSRSLSGAPYLTGATYEISASVSGAFNPLFYNGTIATITEADSLVTSTGTTTVATSGGTISTANAVYATDGTLRSTSTIPYETDTIRLNSKFTLTPSTNENINQTGLGTTSFVSTISGYNFAGTQTSTTSTILYHSGSTFGQPLSSGSMAYYGASQASDVSATTLYEPFLGENYRIQLTDNVLAFTGTAWDTTFGLYNLGAQDLQVKPGYLVKPGGTYSYWLANPSTASDYKYYIRKFNSGAVAAKSTMTLNLGTTLVGWDASTANSAAAVVLFESSKNTVYTPARVYDPTKTLANFVSTISANTDGQNPFGSSIALYGNNGGSVSSNTYTIPIRNADGMFINATYDEIYVIVRYKGDVAPITAITVTFS